MNHKQKKFIQWLVTPVDSREPKSEDDLAKVLNCRPSTLRHWFNQPEFQAALNLEIRHQMDLQKGATFQTLLQKALQGDFRSIKTILEFLGQYPVPKDGLALSDQGTMPFTLEEYTEALKLVREWEEQEFGHLDPTHWR